jgi:hypothetical protein
MKKMLPLVTLAAALAAAPAAIAQVGPASPIPNSGPEPSTPKFVGHVAKAKPLPGVPAAWQNPLMARNPLSGVHNDAWQSDSYTQYGGPLGKSSQTLSNAIGRVCVSITFDKKGRIEATCVDLTGPVLYLMDPVTLDVLAQTTLPYVPPAGNPATNTTGGAYFFLDNQDRAVIATADRKITVYRTDESSGTPQFEQVTSYDPTPCLDPGDRMPSALPDAQGRYWFVGRTKGSVGVLDPKTGKCGGIVLNEEIENSFAVASDGVYIVTDHAQYKFRAGADLTPKTVWRSKNYGNIGQMKPGQFNAGSGTTPTLIRGFTKQQRKSKAPTYVAITDNADPMDVVVYRAGNGKVVCTVPVFKQGASDTENSIISMGRSLFVENNYGYDLTKFNDQLGHGVPLNGDRSLVSEPGIARVDINANGKGCKKVWENDTVRAPSVVAKGNARNGLLYTFENVKDPQTSDADPWYWTTLDVRTGKVVYKVLAGWGGGYNNHYAGLALGRNPSTHKITAYLGGIGGVMAMRDGA